MPPPPSAPSGTAPPAWNSPDPPSQLARGLPRFLRRAIKHRFARYNLTVKRLRRIIFNALTMPRLILCVALGICWIRSYFASEYLSFPLGRGGQHRLQLGWVSGCIFGGTVNFPIPEPFLNSYPPVDLTAIAAGNPQFQLTGPVGFDYSPQVKCAFIRFWLVLPLVTVSLAYRLWRKRTAREPGRCPQCSYDLRATPDRCPECGPPQSIAKA